MRPEAIKTAEEIRDQGFPEAITQAFLQTADETKTIVITRVPGRATTDLIAAGHDLKGFFIKAKSCDWGPMAGFLCELGPFNKKGADNIDSNEEANLKYMKLLAGGTVNGVDGGAVLKGHEHGESSGFLTSLRETRDLDVVVGRRLRPGDEESQPVVGKRTIRVPFIGLEISDDRRRKVESTFLGDVEGGMEEVDSDTIVGIAVDPTNTVRVEFLLKRKKAGLFRRKERRWSLFHGRVFARKDKAGPFEERDAPEQDKRGDEPIPRSEEHASALRRLPGVDDAPTEGLWWPIRGIMNPYPPFRSEPHRNAVSGDYDLFSVWGAIIQNAGVTDERSAELRSTIIEPDDVEGTHFLAVQGRRFSVSIAQRNIVIEFIPPIGSRQLREDETFGNISAQIQFTAQMLNSFAHMAVAKKSRGESRNIAYHSDEGGRPGIHDLDLPVAAFRPDARPLRNQIKNVLKGALRRRAIRDGDGAGSRSPLPDWREDERILLITTPEDFIDLLIESEVFFNINVSAGWIEPLMCICLEPAELRNRATTDDKKVADHFTKMIKSQEGVLSRNPELDAFRKKVFRLILGDEEELDADRIQQLVNDFAVPFADIVVLDLTTSPPVSRTQHVATLRAIVAAAPAPND